MSNRGPPAAHPIPQYAQTSPSMDSRNDHNSPGIWTDDGYASPTNPSRPLTGSSYASTSSSYSLPENAPPMPQPPPAVTTQARARAPLGPPPSARRGPPSYYPQQHQSLVQPIVEETDSQRGSIRNFAGSRSSYASSNAIPIGVPDYYLNNRSEEPMSQSTRQEDFPRAESPPGLIRQASLGKRSKPTLTTIKSGENIRPGMMRTQSQGSVEEVYDEKRHGQDSVVTGRRISSGVLGKEMLHSPDRSSSESERSDYNRMMRSKDYLAEPLPALNARATESTASDVTDPRIESIIGRLEKGGALSQGASPVQPSSLSQRIGSRRPTRLDVDAVREAEQRGSLTSLPDLIRRATKLASNLDRGRTASRLGFAWMEGEKNAPKDQADDRRSGSLSEMISAFPPPALGTPMSGRGFNWSPSRLRHHNALPSEDGAEARSRRRICGMKLWVFLLLLLLLLVLIAAAIVIPIVLIVLPRQHGSATQLATCSKSLTCSNGGLNIMGRSGSCQCLCVNGFTGATCSIAPAAGCTTTSVNGNSDATVGDSLPRLFSGAQTNFSIPINGQTVLGLFSSTNLSCASENALVTFNGASSKRSIPLIDDLESGVILNIPGLPPTKTLEARAASTSTSTDAAVTTDGIMFATGSPSGATSASSSSPTSVSSSNSTSSSGTNSTLTADLDFARVAVLFVLQDSAQLNDAIEAQEALQSYFSTGETTTGAIVDTKNITLQNGYTANLDRRTLVVPNGTTVG